MDTKKLPTKNNLIKIQTSIKQSKEGQVLLEEKRMILIRELDKYVEQEKTLRKTGQNLLNEAYYYLQMANIEIGIDDMINISEGVKIDTDIDIKYKTVMGIEIPSIVQEKQDITINYGLYNTTNSVDMAIIKFMEVKKYILELAQIENSIIRLKKDIEKVQRRSNALKEIIIPNDEKNAQEIQDILEENEREEFVRIKNIKKRKR